MVFQVLAIVLGVIVGWIRRGKISNLSLVRFRLLWILPLAYFLQYISIYYTHGLIYQVMVTASYIGLIVFCSLNVKQPGLQWALMGVVSNFLVMLANHLRMPAYIAPVEKYAPDMVSKLREGAIGKSIAMGPNTHLNFLGDIFTVDLGVRTLVSIGDLLFSVGLFLFIVTAMGGPQVEKSTP